LFAVWGDRGERLDSSAHHQLALRAAEESVVLLKNDGILPLRALTGSIAAIGPTADMLKVLEANYHGTALHPVTPLEGLRSGFRNVRYAQGSLLAHGLSAPVPRNALRLGAGSNSRYGLHAEYFNTAGTPVVQTTVEKIDFDLNRVGFVPALGEKGFAAR
jgi:beta-glucosidase